MLGGSYCASAVEALIISILNFWKTKVCTWRAGLTCHAGWNAPFVFTRRVYLRFVQRHCDATQVLFTLHFFWPSSMCACIFSCVTTCVQPAGFSCTIKCTRLSMKAIAAGPYRKRVLGKCFHKRTMPPLIFIFDSQSLCSRCVACRRSSRPVSGRVLKLCWNRVLCTPVVCTMVTCICKI